MKEKSNPFNVYESTVEHRQQEIKTVVTGTLASENLDWLKKCGERATTITLTINREDKALVKKY